MSYRIKGAFIASPKINADKQSLVRVDECSKTGANGELIMISVRTEESHEAQITGNYRYAKKSPTNDHIFAHFSFKFTILTLPTKNTHI